MSNQLGKQIIEEGPRNAVVKLTGVLTNSDVTLNPAISPSDFKNNDVRMTLTGFRVDEVLYSLSGNLEATLYWGGNTMQVITPVARSGKIDVAGDGGFLPDQTASGFDGSIDLITTGFAAGTTQTYSVTLRLVKLYKV